VSQLLERLRSYHEAYFQRGVTPDLSSRFQSTLYSTFLSYLDPADRVRRPPVHADARGDLCELVKTDAGGQTFFSTTAPGVTRGDHYHTRKIEWFCVVRGEAAIRLRPVGGGPVTEFRVSGARPAFVSIPVMHAHSIENVGETDLLTVFWCNELFDPADADTFYEQVLTDPAKVAA